MNPTARLLQLRLFASGGSTGFRADVAFLLEQLDARDETIRALLKAKRVAPRIPPTIHAIVRVVCDHTGVAAADIFGPKRYKSIARARHAAMLIARTVTDYSFPEIGASFGGRDHTTVMSAVQRAKHHFECDPGFAAMLEACFQALEPKPTIVDAVEPGERVRVA